MIGKKIPNPDHSASKAVRVEGLVSYVLAPESESSTEKCIYVGARGFLTTTAAGQTGEMVALAEDAVRTRDPIEHYVISWREGEQPSPEQIEEAVDILIDEMGLQNHQVIYGLHADTDNVHLHVVVNRVDPDSGRVKKINRGFDVKALHRAVWRIERAQSWMVDDNPNLREDAEGNVVWVKSEDVARPQQPQQRQLDAERRTGVKSAERTATETARPVIGEARTWPELHGALAALGMRYEKVRNGAVVFVGTVPVKASRVSRQATLRSLESRLGRYQPADPSLEPVIRPKDAAPLIAAASSWSELHANLEAQGMRYDRIGSGARVIAGNAQVKASEVGREASLGRLEKRLGPYQPPDTRSSAREPPERISPPTIDRESIARQIGASSSWTEFYAGLARMQLRYERVGSGAYFVAGDRRVKASVIWRGATVNALEKRFGPFQPTRGGLPPVGSQPIVAEMAELDVYRREGDAYRTEKESDRLEFETQYEEELHELQRKQAQERDELVRGRSWKGRGVELNAMRSVLAAEHAKAKAKLEERRRRARETHWRRFPPWPSFEQWLLDQGLPELAQQWRYRAHPIPFIEGRSESHAAPRDIRGYESQVEGPRVVYRRKGSPRSAAAFTDVGSRVNVLDWRSEASTLAALQLSELKWGEFVITGNDEFKEMCVRLAAEHGFRITNPDLQDRIAEERAQRQAEEEAAEHAQAAEPTADRTLTELADETDDVARYSEEAVRLAEEFRRLQAKHGELSLRVDVRMHGGTEMALTFVDTHGESRSTERATASTIAAMRALVEQRSPDEIPEIKRTLEHDIALELARSRGLTR